MSDPKQPKAPQGAPTESPTKAFVLKMDGWMTDLLKSDLEADIDAPAEPTPPEGAPTPPEGGDRRSG